MGSRFVCATGFTKYMTLGKSIFSCGEVMMNLTTWVPGSKVGKDGMDGDVIIVRSTLGIVLNTLENIFPSTSQYPLSKPVPVCRISAYNSGRGWFLEMVISGRLFSKKSLVPEIGDF